MSGHLWWAISVLQSGELFKRLEMVDMRVKNQPLDEAELQDRCMLCEGQELIDHMSR